MRFIKYILIFTLIFAWWNFSGIAQEDCSELIDLAWVKSGGGNQNDEVLDLATDNEGNIYITGFFQNELTFQDFQITGMGGKDLFVAKLDPDGNIVWLEAGLGEDDVYGSGIAVDNQGNIYVTGTYYGNFEIQGNQINAMGQSDVFLFKFNNDGEYLWGQYFGGFYNDRSGNIALDNQENPVIIGSFFTALYIDGSIIVSNGANDYFVAKFSQEGNLIWALNDGSNFDTFGKDIACDQMGNIFVTGDFSGELTIGTETLSAGGVFDVFAVKYSPDGSPQWLRAVGGPGISDKAGAIHADTYGNVYVALFLDQAGITGSGKIIKLSENGTDLAEVFLGNNNTYIEAVKTDAEQNIYVTGRFSGTTDFGSGTIAAVGSFDYFFLKYDQDENLLFEDVTGSSAQDNGFALSVNNDNSVVVAGYHNDGINFDGISYPSQGLRDLLVVKYDKYFQFSEIQIFSPDCNPANMCVKVEVSGGVPPYSYLWSSGHTEDSICGISVGNYSVTVTDSENCYIISDVNIYPPENPEPVLPSAIQICPHDPVLLDAGEGFQSYLWNTGQETQTILISEPGTYSVTVTDENNCEGTASVVANVIPSPNLLVGKEEFICPGDDITFSLQGYESYLWSDGSTDPTFTASEEGTFWVMVFDGQCFFYDTIVIIFYPQPEVDLGDHVDLCQGDTAYFDAGEGFVSYLWHDNSQEQYYSTTETELISVIVVDENGCEATDALVVTVSPPPYVNLGHNDTICTDDPVILRPGDFEDNNTYLWSDGSTADSLAVFDSGEYWVIVTNEQNCSVSDTISLEIFPAVNIDLGPDIDFCEGESYTFSVDDQYVYYLWSTGDTTNVTTVFGEGIVSVTVTDKNSCQGIDSVNMTLRIVPEPYLGNDTILCEGAEMQIITPDIFMHYKWQDGSTSHQINVSSPGTYSLTVTDNFGCTNSASVIVDYVPNPQIIDVYNYPEYVEIIVINGTPAYEFSHDKTDLWQDSQLFHQLPAGTYTFTVIDRFYCTDHIKVEVIGSIIIPSFFTPNSDGYNDFWEIEGIFNFPNAEIQIFDRFGKKLAEFNGTNLKWDGNYLGRPLPSDTYWYVIRLQDGADPMTGSVTIKR